MSDLILNSFPVEITPHTLALPFAEYDDWPASTEGRNRDYRQYSTYRYDRTRLSDDDVRPGKRIRLLLLSGPSPSISDGVHEIDLGVFPSLGARLVEHTLSRHLASQGMTLRRTPFQNVALTRVENSPGDLIHLYSGISYQARRPFSAEKYAFTLSVQWEARAIFSDNLSNSMLRSISSGLAVLYTPKTPSHKNLQDFENHYLGHVKQIGPGDEAVVECRDGQTRSVPVADLTLEASPEAIRRYEREKGTSQQAMRTWRKIQQISKVLTKEGRRNPLVLRDRLDAIRSMLGGRSREQLMLPLHSYSTGTVSIGLAPMRAEIPA